MNNHAHQYPGEEIVALWGSYLKSPGEENNTNGIAQSSKAIIKKKRPEKRKMRNRDFKSDKTWEGRWWRNRHPLCLKCKEGCKQSSKVKIISCPQFKEGTNGKN